AALTGAAVVVASAVALGYTALGPSKSSDAAKSASLLGRARKSVRRVPPGPTPCLHPPILSLLRRWTDPPPTRRPYPRNPRNPRRNRNRNRPWLRRESPPQP
ncbi:hypothetical protein B0H11DRAFT_2046753, partial [Mycena galericulata]